MNFLEKNICPPEEILQKYKTKEELARFVYEDASRLKYGISGSLESKEWVRYPHELNGQANCHEMAVYCYSLARSLGLNPRFFKISSQGVEHSMIDVDADGKKILVNPFYDQFGEIVHYEDRMLELKKNVESDEKRVKYGWIKEISEKELVNEFESIRQSCIPLLVTGQKISEADEGDYDDFIRYLDDNKILERRIQTEDSGFLNNLVKISHFFDEEGKVYRKKVELFDYKDSTWNDYTDLVKIAEIKEGQQEFCDKFSDEFKENVVRTLKYDKLRGDSELLYDEENLKQFSKDYRKHVEIQAEFGTDYRKKQIEIHVNNLEKLEKNYRKNFMKSLDWHMFLSENRDFEIPDDEEFRKIIPRYAERHLRFFEAATRSPNQKLVKNAIDDIGKNVRKEYDKGKIKKALEDIKNYGVSSVYSELSGTLSTLIESPEEVEVAEKIDRFAHFYPIIMFSKEIREKTGYLIKYAKYRRLRYGSPEDTISKIESNEDVISGMGKKERDTFPIYYGFDENRNTFEVRSKISDKISWYDSFIDGISKFDDFGKRKSVSVIFYDTIPGSPEKIFFKNTGSMKKSEKLGNIWEGMKENLPNVIKTGNIASPEPSSNRNFIDRNIETIAFYASISKSDKEYPEYFTKEELDEYYDTLKMETEELISCPFTSPGERKDEMETKKELEEARNKGENKFYSKLESSKIRNMIILGRRDDLREILYKKHGTESKLGEIYMDKFKLIASTFYDKEYAQTKKGLRLAMHLGMMFSVPGSSDVSNVGYDTEVFEEVNAVNSLIEQRRPWKTKGPEINRGLDRIGEKILDLGSGMEKKHLDDCLKSFELRMYTRKAYKDWCKTAEASPLENVREIRKGLKKIKPVVEIDLSKNRELYDSMKTALSKMYQ